MKIDLEKLLSRCLTFMWLAAIGCLIWEIGQLDFHQIPIVPLKLGTQPSSIVMPGDAP